MSEEHTAEKDTPVPDDGDPWRCAECGGRREVHIVGERDGTVTHVWQPRVFPPGSTDAQTPATSTEEER